MGQAKARQAAQSQRLAADTRCTELEERSSVRLRCEIERDHDGPHVFTCPDWFDYQVDCVLPFGHDGRHRFEWGDE